MFEPKRSTVTVKCTVLQVMRNRLHGRREWTLTSIYHNKIQSKAVKWEFENNNYFFFKAKFLMLCEPWSGVWYKTIWLRKQWKTKLDHHTSGILYEEFSPCALVLQESYLHCILDNNSVTTKYFFYSKQKIGSCWDFQSNLNLPNRLPNSTLFQVSLMLKWPQMLWLAETPH